MTEDTTRAILADALNALNRVDALLESWREELKHATRADWEYRRPALKAHIEALDQALNGEQ
jgi:hypothetical protein